MSTGLVANEFSSGINAGIGVYRGQIGGVAEQNRAIAEIQAALTVAAARPRDEQVSMDRVLTACQRLGLAERAEYSFSRGGTDIAGATIDLMTTIANCWGNIQFGFRELSQQNGESVVEAFAWDLETNAKRIVVFTVPHQRYANKKLTPLVDPRDIYELVANNAQRRVRACLEAVIPPDVVDAAMVQCQETIKAKDPVTPDKIVKLVEAFEKEFKVSKEQIEARLQRRVDTITSAQMIAMKRIWKSLRDGMSTPEDWFKSADAATPSDEPSKGTAAVKEKLKAKQSTKAQQTESQNSVATIEDELKGDSIDPVELEIREKMRTTTTTKGLDALKRAVMEATLGMDRKNALLDEIDGMLSIIDAS